MENFFDQFDAGSTPTPEGNFFDRFDAPAEKKPSVLGDVVEQAGAGVPAGLSNAIGMIGDYQGLTDRVLRYILKRGGLHTDEEIEKIASDVKGTRTRFPTSGEVKGKIEEVTGEKIPEPQTPAGKFARSVTESVTSMPMMPVTGMVMGAGAEAGEQLTGSPWWRLAGALSAAGLSSIVQAFRGMPAKVISDALKNVSEADLKAADDLVKQSVAAGTPITGPEAIAQVTGGNQRLTAMQRVVEQSPQGSEAMQPMMAARPGANAAALDAEAAKIGPAIVNPTEIAPRVQAASKGVVEGERQVTNALSQAAYDATANNPNAVLSSKAFAAVNSNPAFAEAIKAVRSDAIKYGDLKGLGDDSLSVLDAAKKYLDDVAIKSAREGENFASSNAGKAAEALTLAIDAEFPRYASARNIQAFRKSYVEEPLERAPTGLLAAAEKFPEQAAIVFNPNPLPGSQKGIGDAIRAVAAKDPEAARQFVRAHIERTFSELAQKTAGGPNQFGGAAFAANVSGNAQQAKNLKAAIEALPNGQEVSKSFFNLLKIFEAQGMRARPGAQTAFNKEIQETIQGSNPIVEGVAKGVSPGKWLTAIDDFRASMAARSNAEKLAKIFTSPDSVKEMRNIAKILPDSRKAQLLYSMLVGTTANAPEGKSDGE